DYVEAFIEFCEQQADIGWVILEITVHRNDDRALGIVKTGRHGCSLSEVAPKVDYFDVRVLIGQAAKRVEGSVGAAVVNKNNFKGLVEPGQRGVQSFIQWLNAFLLIEERDNDREIEFGAPFPGKTSCLHDRGDSSRITRQPVLPSPSPEASCAEQ